MRDTTYYQFKYFLSRAFDNMFAFANLRGFFPFLSFCFLICLKEGKTQLLECSLGPLMGCWELFLPLLQCDPKGSILAQRRCPVRLRFGMRTGTPPRQPSAGDNAPGGQSCCCSRQAGMEGLPAETCTWYNTNCLNLQVQTFGSKRAFIHLKPAHTHACALLTQGASS